MADTVSSSNELKLNFNFVDGDTRTQTLPNPLNNIQESDVHTVSTLIQTTGFVIGDKNGASTTGIGYADRIQKRTTKYDLS